MRFAYLLPLDAYEHHCCTSEGLEVLRDHTNRVCGVATTVYRREQGPRRFGGSLIVKTAGSIRERLAGRDIGDPLACGEGPRLSTELPDQELGPYEGLQRGLGGSLCASRYLGKNTRVVDGSLHISTLLFSFRIYIICITPFAVEIATHLSKS